MPGRRSSSPALKTAIQASIGEAQFGSNVHSKMLDMTGFDRIGSATHETRDAMAQRAVDNIGRALQGQRPISLVNEKAWRP